MPPQLYSDPNLKDFFSDGIVKTVPFISSHSVTLQVSKTWDVFFPVKPGNRSCAHLCPMALLISTPKASESSLALADERSKHVWPGAGRRSKGMQKKWESHPAHSWAAGRASKADRSEKGNSPKWMKSSYGQGWWEMITGQVGVHTQLANNMVQKIA